MEDAMTIAAPPRFLAIQGKGAYYEFVGESPVPRRVSKRNFGMKASHSNQTRLNGLRSSAT
jgi:hypothetical protein